MLESRFELGALAWAVPTGEQCLRQHIPGAVNLTAENVPALADRLLPDKDAANVTYCSNPACHNSTQVAGMLEQLGYTNVRRYAEGIQDWTEAGYALAG